MNIYYKINKILNYKNYSVRNKIDGINESELGLREIGKGWG